MIPATSQLHKLQRHYSCFRVLSPVRPLPIAVTHVSKVLEPRSSREVQWQLACEAPQFQNYDHVSDCSVQWANGTRALKQLYSDCTTTHLPISITDKDHLMKEFPIRSGLGYDLPKDEQQFLECVVTLWHHILDDGHQKAGETLSVQHQLNYPLQSCSFVPDISITCNRERASLESKSCTKGRS